MNPAGPNCTRVRPLIERLVEGDLSPRDTRAVAAHTDACTECGELVADLRAERDLLLQVIGPPAVSEDLGERLVHGAFEGDTPAAPAPAVSSTGMPRTLLAVGLVGVAIAAAVVVVAALTADDPSGWRRLHDVGAVAQVPGAASTGAVPARPPTGTVLSTGPRATAGVATGDFVVRVQSDSSVRLDAAAVELLRGTLIATCEQAAASLPVRVPWGQAVGTGVFRVERTPAHPDAAVVEVEDGEVSLVGTVGDRVHLGAGEVGHLGPDGARRGPPATAAVDGNGERDTGPDLTGDAVVAGTVTDRRGRPLSPAEVVVLYDGRVIASDVTDPDGLYRVDGLNADLPLRLEARYLGIVQRLSAPPPLRSGETITVDFTMRSLVELTCLVTGPAGGPVVAAEVRLQVGADVLERATTGRDGSVRFVQAPRNTPVVVTVLPPAPLEAAWVRLPAGATVATALDVTLEEHGEVSGRVVTAAGRGLRGARVAAVPPGDSLPGTEATSGADGNFDLDRVPVGWELDASGNMVRLGRRVTAALDGRVPASAAATDGDVVLVLEEPARVVMEMPTGVDARDLVLVHPPGARLAAAEGPGDRTITGLAREPVLLLVRVPGHAPLDIVVDPRRTSRLRLPAPERAGAVRGTVNSPDGPVPAGWVTLSRAEDAAGAPIGRLLRPWRGVVDGGGFRVEDLHPGTYALAAGGPGLRTEVTTITVPAGGEATPPTLVLQRGARRRVMLRADGRPVDAVPVFLDPDTGLEVARGRALEPGVSVVDGLPSGTWIVVPAAPRTDTHVRAPWETVQDRVSVNASGDLTLVVRPR